MVAEIEEPDFVREEREAWSKRSPRIETDIVAQSQPPSYGRATRSSRPNPDIVLQPPRVSREPPPQPRKQSKQSLPLREFGPDSKETDLDERPKTSRGPSSFGEGNVSLRTSEDSEESASIPQETRRSRFVEGSLNERSAAVASSWYDHDSASEDSYGFDATPQASKDTRGSSSFESVESKAMPITPATVKRTKLFKLKGSIKPSGESQAEIEQQGMPKKRGLRKSLSTWSFHNLGDKMKIFSGSTNDPTQKAPKLDKEQHRVSKTPAGDSAKDVLDERKRKAEEAYAQQFGLKKQKSNSGIANATHPSQVSVATKPSSLKRRTPSSSSSALSSNNWNRVTSSSTSHSFASDKGSSDVDDSKRPSRKELEKENQHLRKMLRQSSSMQFDAHRSSVHLPLDEAPSHANIPRLSQENFAQGHKIRISPGKKMGRRGEDVPPVPKLSRQVLGSLENEWKARATTDGKGMIPRPVSMILEEEECKDGSDIDIANGGKLQVSSVGEQWEWPDDVF